MAELELMAEGANGGPVIFDENYNNLSIIHILGLRQFVQFQSAVRERYFSDAPTSELFGPFIGLHNIVDWTDFETLADAILAEKKRLASVAKQKGGAQ